VILGAGGSTRSSSSGGCYSFADTVTPEQASLVQQVVSLVPCIEWLCSSLATGNSNSSGNSLFLISHLRLARDLLQSLLSQQEATATADKSKDQRSSSLVLSSSMKNLEWKRLIWGYRSTRALVYLAETTAGNDDDLIIHDILAQHQQQQHQLLRDGAFSLDCNDCEFGTAWLEFAISWSGLHKTPWSSCVAAEARTLIAQARACITLAESEWGRQSLPLEHWILELAQADAEVASLAGGLLTEAQNLYFRVLEATIDLNKDAIVDPTLVRILQSKCYSGLVSLSLRSTSGEQLLASMPEEDMRTSVGLARRNLDLLQSIEMDAYVASLYLWKSVEATKSSIRFQLAFVRQQVADCLLRKGLANEAQTFLEDAVRLSPDDAGAALALGAFRLRVMFFGENRSSSDVAKAAQIQLLKAAKLDANKPSPFALLGYWYEYVGDEKRALGCYSKALLLDPSHPVAGRGLLRLKHLVSLLPLLEKATDSGMSTSGWAWRALGVHKAMDEGNDDLAVVSFLQALRSRDVQNPSTEPLSIFFYSPFSPREPDKQEFVDASADLAASYRRLGRFTASLRSYYSALEASGEIPSGAILNACAHGTWKVAIVHRTYHPTDCTFLLRSRN
jgi:tetratricopeptide (TPR) repeat protein